jgi:hypothetical protein
MTNVFYGFPQSSQVNAWMVCYDRHGTSPLILLNSMYVTIITAAQHYIIPAVDTRFNNLLINTEV